MIDTAGPYTGTTRSGEIKKNIFVSVKFEIDLLLTLNVKSIIQIA